MSSTNRGSVRNERDFYATPLSAFSPIIPLLPCNVAFWEPACGDGRLVFWLAQSGRTANGADLEPQHPKFPVRDFLKDGAPADAQFIITNPPFSLAFEFAQKAVSSAPEVMLLLRLNFLASRKRQEWFRNNRPSALFVLSARPSFTNGGTDSCDYAWFYWGKRYGGIFFP